MNAWVRLLRLPDPSARSRLKRDRRASQRSAPGRVHLSCRHQNIVSRANTPTGCFSLPDGKDPRDAAANFEKKPGAPECPHI